MYGYTNKKQIIPVSPPQAVLRLAACIASWRHRDFFWSWRMLLDRFPDFDVKSFMSKLNSPSINGCWTWVAKVDKFGYGVFRRKIKDGAKYMRAHRVMYELFVGDIPPGMFVCHKCDNPPCVNPAHLFVGTCADNNRDMRNKGRDRAPIGSRQHLAKLNDDKVIEILRLLRAGRSQKEIASMFSVTQSCISVIAIGKTWKHISREIANGR